MVAGLVGVLIVLGMLTEFIRGNRVSAPSRSQILGMPETWALLGLLWLLIITSWQTQSSSVQNLIVYSVALCALSIGWHDVSRLTAIFPKITLVLALVLICAGVLGTSGEMPFSVIGMNPRIYAMYAVLAACMVFAIKINQWVRASLLALLYMGVVVSDSRAAFVTLAIVVVLGYSLSARQPLRIFVLGASASLAVVALTLKLPSISERMAISDLTTPGMPINDSGRGPAWSAVLDSWLSSPIIGQGAGSSQTVAGQATIPLEHPHNEYLRVLHDSGLVGGVIATAFLVTLIVSLWPRRGGALRSRMVLSGFLLIPAALVIGTVENYLVFPSIMWPAAAVVALALHASRRKGSAASLS